MFFIIKIPLISSRNPTYVWAWLILYVEVIQQCLKLVLCRETSVSEIAVNVFTNSVFCGELGNWNKIHIGKFLIKILSRGVKMFRYRQEYHIIIIPKDKKIVNRPWMCQRFLGIVKVIVLTWIRLTIISYHYTWI